MGQWGGEASGVWGWRKSRHHVIVLVWRVCVCACDNVAPVKRHVAAVSIRGPGTEFATDSTRIWVRSVVRVLGPDSG